MRSQHWLCPILIVLSIYQPIRTHPRHHLLGLDAPVDELGHVVVRLELLHGRPQHGSVHSTHITASGAHHEVNLEYERLYHARYLDRRQSHLTQPLSDMLQNVTRLHPAIISPLDILQLADNLLNSVLTNGNTGLIMVNQSEASIGMLLIN